MANYQINLTGAEIDERLQGVGKPTDVGDASGSLYARTSKNADDISELNDEVARVKEAQTATEAKVEQNATDISTLQTTVSNNKDEQDAIAEQVRENASAIGTNKASIADHEARLSEVEDMVHRGLPVYGVEWNVNQTSSDVTRIGIPELHRTLPCHQLRGCLLADNGTVNEYLPQDDWTSATRDGSKGQVMVEIPEMWMKFEIDGDMRRVLLSPVPIGGFKHYQKRYVSAYEATVQRSTNKLASVVNTSEDYRGGDSATEYDGTELTMLGKPRTALSRTTFQTYARNRYPNAAWNMYVYDVHCQLTWLFVVEYATLNSQKPFNAGLTAEGYRQGGLGDGLTTLSWEKWVALNNAQPIMSCGKTDSLGNNTGVVSVSIESQTFDAPRYRGVENIFGHIGQIVIECQFDNQGGAWVSDNYTNPLVVNLDKYYKGETPKASGNINNTIFKDGIVAPNYYAKNNAAIYSDQFYFGGNTVLRDVSVGGRLNHGTAAGVFEAEAISAGGQFKTTGTRLCYLPQEDNSGTLRDLYISAGAKYNEQTGYYELNGLTDITEEEMRVIYQESLAGWYLRGRTNLTKNISALSNSGGYNSGIDISNICWNNSNIILFNFGIPPFVKFCDNAFSGCTKLETIDTRFSIIPYNGTVGPNIFRGCTALKEVRFNMQYLRYSTNVNFPVSTLISKESILSIITTTPTSGTIKPFVVIGLNDSAYNRLKDDTDIQQAITDKNGFVTLTQI